MIIGKLTLSSVAIDGTADPAHQRHILSLDSHSFAVNSKRICYYNNVLAKILVIGDTGLTLKFID
jgi:hypothetical protein